MSVEKECIFVSIGLVLTTFECVICQGKRTDSTLSDCYEKLVKCQTLDGAQTLQKCAHERGDNKYLLAQIGHLSAEGIVGKEFWYHSSCRRNYTRPIKEKSTDCIKYQRFCSADCVHRKKYYQRRKYKKIHYSSR